MKCLRFALLILVGAVMPGVTGCDSGTPQVGSRAIVAADHLEKQQSKIEQIRATLKARPSTKSSLRR